VTTERAGLLEQVRRIALDLRRVVDDDLAPAVEAAIRRLDEPLRVAIAGRTKAGKSTLLNALVGERLAATDAGECTRIVTWYRHAAGYRVAAELRSSGNVELPFRRENGALLIELGGRDPEDIERIDVGWPARRLLESTLIDTPGLGSSDEASSARTATALLDDEGDRPGEADAVIYLMRHLHRSDAQFLEAFVDHSLAHASPVNAILVLSRADEIGAARPDALESARAVAARYADDQRIRELASGVVPVAGLIAETGVTLREQQVTWLREIAGLAEASRASLLRSVDRFRDPELNPLLADIREELLERFGLFGLRLSVGLLVGDRDLTATGLSQALIGLSGIAELQSIVDDRFAARADALKARSALAAFRGIADDLVRRGRPGAAEIAADIEQVEAGSEQLALLRLLHLVLTGLVEVSPDERLEVHRLTDSTGPAARAGLAAGASSEAIRTAALGGIERWRVRAANPLTDRRTIEAADIVVRTYERLYLDAGDAPASPPG
jgi:50S ribosome-binding GTPase